MKIIKELTVEEEQAIQLDILKHFSYICESEKLTYFLTGGTLLGACRNNGFIPWDDDVDIWMPRKDYQRFLDAYSQFEKKEYFLQTYKTDPGFLHPDMARICVNNTYKCSDKYDGTTFHKGIYFDIFPLDYGFGDWRDNYYIYKKKICSALLLSKALKNPKSGSNNIIKRTVYKTLYFLNSERRLRSKIKKIVEKYSALPHSSVVICFPSAFAGKRFTVFKSIYFDKAIQLQFNGVNMPCPENYHSLLKYMYGDDYMTPIKTKPNYVTAYLVEPDL